MGAGASASDVAGLDIAGFRRIRAVYESGCTNSDDNVTLLRSIKASLRETSPPQGPRQPSTAAKAEGTQGHGAQRQSCALVEKIDFDYVLSSLQGEFFFTEWVFAGAGPAAAQLFGLLLEIRDFKQAPLDASGDMHRRRRADLIMKRFCPLRLGLEPLIGARERLVQVPPAPASLPTDLFDEAFARAKSRMISNFFGLFRQTAQFSALAHELAKALDGKNARLAARIGGKSTRASCIDKEQEVAPWAGGHARRAAGGAPSSLGRSIYGAALGSETHAPTKAAVTPEKRVKMAGISEGTASSPPMDGDMSPSPLKPYGSPSGQLPEVRRRRVSQLSARVAAIRFEDVLHDRLGMFLFKSYCRSTFDEASLLYTLEAGAFARQAEDAAFSDEQVLARGTNIYRKYFDVGGTLELPLDAVENGAGTTARAEVTRALLRLDPSSTALDACEEKEEQKNGATAREQFLRAVCAVRGERLKFLEKDAWPQFLASKVFKEWSPKLLPRLEEKLMKQEAREHEQHAEEELNRVTQLSMHSTDSITE